MSLLLASIAQPLVSLAGGRCEVSDFTSPNTATLTFETDGTISGLTTATSYNWFSLAPLAGVGGNYEIFATRTAGTLPTGTLDTWLPLTGAVGWQLTQSGVGEKRTTLTIKIRTTSGSELASASYVIVAEVL